MSVKLVIAVVIVFASSCGAPCTPVDRSQSQSACHPSDAGPITAGAPFVLMASTSLLEAKCTVSVDGGQIDLSISGSNFCSASGANVAKPPSLPARCDVPALPEGAYTVNTLSPLSFSLPDAGVPSCP